MMEDPKNVIEAIARVMAELPAIGRDSQASSQQGGYAYRGIEAITGEAQPLFGKYGVVFIPRVVSSETRELVVNGKPWTDTVLGVEYSVYGPGGVEDCIKVGPLVAIGRDNSDKGANKAMTQAFKYALLQVLCISDRKDDGDQTVHETEARYTDRMPEDAIATLKRQLGDLTPEARERVKELWIDRNLPQIDHLTRSQFGTADKLVQAEVIRSHQEAAQAPESVEGGNPSELPLDAPEANTGPSPQTEEEKAEEDRRYAEELEKARTAAALLPQRALVTSLRSRMLKSTGGVEELRERLAEQMAVESLEGLSPEF